MKRPHGIRVRFGQFEFVKLNAERAFDWRDTYHFVLTLGWPGFAALVFGIYLLVNLVFAFPVSCLKPRRFERASWKTQQPIGKVGFRAINNCLKSTI